MTGATAMRGGIIFDCDGTLADSMPSHYEAWRETLEEHGLAMDEDRFYALGGWPTLKVAELVVQESGRDIDPFTLAARKEARFEENLHLVRPIGPVVAVVRENVGRCPLGVATGAIRRICEQILQNLGIRDCFGAVVTADDVERHKPAPDIYLEAARRLNIEPAECVVYEDTDPGIEAARNAGMQTVDVRTFYTPRRVTP